jgi:hypothetical protein
MKFKAFLVGGLMLTGAGLVTAQATSQLFTYSYEPETMPANAMEFEQWVTLQSGRTAAVGQDKYDRWNLREELEMGITDRYTVSLYLNTQSESYIDSLGADFSKFSFDGISLENKYQVLNPAEKPVGLTLYLEPTFSGDTAEVEEKIILGQRFGDWKWALNLSHATQWENHLEDVTGEFEASAGIAREFNSHWALALESRINSTIDDYKTWNSTALYVGPTVSYRAEKWWFALTVMPQVWGENYHGNPDNNTHLDLLHNERLNFRFIVGIDL